MCFTTPHRDDGHQLLRKNLGGWPGEKNILELSTSILGKWSNAVLICNLMQFYECIADDSEMIFEGNNPPDSREGNMENGIYIFLEPMITIPDSTEEVCLTWKWDLLG